MRRLAIGSVLVLAVACAVQNNPLPMGNDDESGASGGGGNAGKSGDGGSTSQAGTTNKAGATSAGKSGGGTAGAQGGDAAGGASNGGKSGSSMGGNAGNGGMGGTGGVAGAAGKGGTGGTGGVAGTGGTGGVAGTGGTAGSGGSGGNAGSGGSGGACMAAMSAPVGGLSARFQDEHAGNGTSIGSQLELYNAGPNTLNLADLKVRYYFTNEVTAPLQVSINWAWYRAGEVDKKDKVVFNVVKLTCNATNADTYIEFTFKADAGLLEPAHYLIFSWQATNTQTQSFTQTNDYSYDAAAKIDTDDAKIVIFQNSGTRAWGTEP